jgi:hypothetical protein
MEMEKLFNHPVCHEVEFVVIILEISTRYPHMKKDVEHIS